MNKLFHYYDESTGPFRNLSDQTPQAAEEVLDHIRLKHKGFFASKRSADYMSVRRDLEAQARACFVAKGGLPERTAPHYMTLGECPWLLDWYPQGKVLQMSLAEIDPRTISFTYGDLFPAMRYKDGKPYREQVYIADEIASVIQEFGLPQEWNSEGHLGPERYIEAQIWTNRPLEKWLSLTQPRG